MWASHTTIAQRLKRSRGPFTLFWTSTPLLYLGRLTGLRPYARAYGRRPKYVSQRDPAPFHPCVRDSEVPLTHGQFCLRPH